MKFKHQHQISNAGVAKEMCRINTHTTHVGGNAYEAEDPVCGILQFELPRDIPHTGFALMD